jgi:hypothetical protein
MSNKKQTAVQCLIDQIRFSSKGTFYAMKESGFFTWNHHADDLWKRRMGLAIIHTNFFIKENENNKQIRILLEWNLLSVVFF